MKKRILILGSSSFSGSSTINYLLTKNKYQIIGTYRKKKSDRYLPYKFNIKSNNFKEYKVDFLKNPSSLINLIKKLKPEVIIDFASICMVNESWKNSNIYFQINVLSKIKMIEYLSSTKFLKKYIYISTPEIFGSSKKYIEEKSQTFAPQTPYATSKLSFEILLKNFQKNFSFPLIISRFSNFYGPGQPLYRLIPKLIFCIDNNKKFTLQGDGGSMRNFIFSYDFCTGINKVIDKGRIGKTYHFSGRKFYSVNDIIKNVCDLKSYDKKKLIKKTKSRVGQDFIYKLCSKMTMKELRWKPIYSLKKGLQEIILYHKRHIKNISNKELFYKDKQLKK